MLALRSAASFSAANLRRNFDWSLKLNADMKHTPFCYLIGIILSFDSYATLNTESISRSHRHLLTLPLEANNANVSGIHELAAINTNINATRDPTITPSPQSNEKDTDCLLHVCEDGKSNRNRIEYNRIK